MMQEAAAVHAAAGPHETLFVVDSMAGQDAVNAALRQLVDAELRRRHLRRLETGEGTDLADRDVMKGAWQ